MGWGFLLVVLLPSNIVWALWPYSWMRKRDGREKAICLLFPASLFPEYGKMYPCVPFCWMFRSVVTKRHYEIQRGKYFCFVVVVVEETKLRWNLIIIVSHNSRVDVLRKNVKTGWSLERGWRTVLSFLTFSRRQILRLNSKSFLSRIGTFTLKLR